MTLEDLNLRQEKLNRLLQSGVIGDAEFSTQKAKILAEISRLNAAENAQARSTGFGFQTAADTITDRLGIAKIETFSLSSFFADVLRKHGADEMENILSVGAPLTTPPLSTNMANLPNPWIFFRALLGSIAVYSIFYFAFASFENTKLIPGLIIVGSFAVPISVLLLFFEINTPRNVSLFRVLQFLVVGGASAILFSLILFDLTSLTSILGASAAGIVEESGKLAAVILTMKMLPALRFPFRLNALLLGAAVGTGFAAFESAGYAIEAQTKEEMISLITARGLLSPFGHIIWTAIATAAYWEVRLTHPSIWSAVSSRTFLRLFAVPVALHFVWNLNFELPFMGKYLILGFIGWVVVISLIQTGLKEIADAASVAPGEPLPLGTAPDQPGDDTDATSPVH